MPPLSSAAGCSPALLWHRFTLHVVGSHQDPEQGQEVSMTWWHLRGEHSSPLPQSLVPSFPLTHLNKVQEQFCNWDGSSSASMVLFSLLPTPRVLLHSCLFALRAAATRDWFQAGTLNASSFAPLPLMKPWTPSHSAQPQPGALVPISSQRDCSASAFPWISCISSYSVIKTFLLFQQKKVKISDVLLLMTPW